MPLPPPRSAPIDWLFIDVGGVLLDDTPLLDTLYRFLAKELKRYNEETTLDDVLATRRHLIAEGSERVYKATLRHHAPSEEAAAEILAKFRAWLKPRQLELNPLIPGVPEALEVLAARYHLALAANQGAYIHDLLEKYGIRHYFEVAAISGEMGVAKPNERFFRHLLEYAGTTVEHAVMVGDSLPNDLRPAHELGLRTVRVIAGGDNVPEADAYSFVDGTVAALAELPSLLEGWRNPESGDAASSTDPSLESG